MTFISFHLNSVNDRHTLSYYTFYSMLCVLLLATNINDALLRGVEMLVKDRQEKKLPERSVDMIILLTDGMPNVGEHAECVHTVGYTVVISVHLINVLVLSIHFLHVVSVHLKESVTPQTFRRMCDQLWEETCLCSVLDLEMMWIIPSWM